ncbi:MAG TPA: mechanosensitive ion channel family protein [Desulfobulbus sp.]|nr:mechanosensitive ion channel family protein [Desulfobulbus sp.]
MLDFRLISLLHGLGFSRQLALPLAYIIITCLVLLVALIATWIVRRVLIRLVSHVIRENELHWDDLLLSNRFFHRLSWFVPVTILYLARDLLLPPGHPAADILGRLIMCGFVVVSMGATLALLGAINDIHRLLRRDRGTTISGYVDAARILTFVLGGIFLLAILTDRSPWGLLSVMGGLTAVTMLVFRDSILGFVASIQLTGTDMLRVGDWIEMESHGADGEVLDISIHSVRVQNWDKTITTIPTYQLIAKSFKNWRGMAESGGRRIKRSLHLDMNSIRFITDDELEGFAGIELIRDYVRAKQREIEEYNRAHGVDTSVMINGRRQTNIGIFRAYIAAYLRQHPKIRKDMTFLVRHLEPGPEGLPIQVYVFSGDQVWANYEAIQADIFDHLLAALPWFHLRVFQKPGGADLQRLEDGAAT